jgi:hypothetical protein
MPIGWTVAGVVLLMAYPIFTMVYVLWHLRSNVAKKAQCLPKVKRWRDTTHPGFVAKYGILFQSYKRERYYWKLVIFSVKLTGCFFLTNAFSLSPLATAACLTALYFGYSIAVVAVRPYMRPGYTFMETILSLVYTSIFGLSLVIHSPTFKPSDATCQDIEVRSSSSIVAWEKRRGENSNVDA